MDIQLAKDYDPCTEYENDIWSATPKLDGVRGVYCTSILDPHAGLYSRSAKKLHGFESLSRRLSEIAVGAGWTFIDGELIIPGRKFQYIQGVVTSRAHPDKERVRFAVFAVRGLYGFKNTHAMVRKMRHVLNVENRDERVYAIPDLLIPNDPESIQDACDDYVRGGFEGVVLRHPDIPYRRGRTNALVRYKPFKEADLTIQGAVEGEGKYAGMLGALELCGIAEGRQVRVKCGTGFEDSERDLTLWESRIGKPFTVKYQSLTDKEVDGFYSLRFPSAIGFKEDR